MADWVFAILGLTILVMAGDVLVRGAVNLSLRLGISALVVSLTIVSIGTSAPELLVAVDAVFNGSSGIALGNVVGSNTANVLLVLGVPALIAGLKTTECQTRAAYRKTIIGTAAFVIFAYYAPIGWPAGLALLGLYAIFMFLAVKSARQEPAQSVDAEEPEGADPSLSWARIATFLVMGLVGLPIGADLLVQSATEIARQFDISDAVIGVTLVAVGTSLPELSTTVSAAIRGQADVAMGNVIGSNLANMLGIVGVAALVGPIDVPEAFLRFDIVVMVAASLLLAPFAFGKLNLTRFWGVLFTGGYVAYIVAVLM